MPPSRPPKRPQAYQYKPTDSPLTVANQFGITPQQLFQANPGGYPFSTGQNINVPYGPPAPVYGPPNNGPVFGPPRLQAPPANSTVNNFHNPAPQPLPTNSFLSGSGQNVADYYNQNIMTLNTTPTALPNNTGAPLPGTQQAGTTQAGIQPTPEGNTDFNMTQAAQYNAANNIPFENQLRWDPQRKKYITVGKWLRESQGKGRRRNRNANKAAQQEQQAQDYTVANSLISFGASSG